MNNNEINNVNLSGGIDTNIVGLLRKTLSKCEDHKTGITDEETLKAYLTQYRWRFDEVFDRTEYVRDPRVEKIVRILDYCHRVGFNCQDLFEERLGEQTSPEEAISTFRIFFRMAAIMITEQIGSPEIIKQMKISGVKNPNDSILPAATDLASSIRRVADNKDEIYAALVMLKSGIID